MSSVQIKKRPLVPVITIAKNGGGVYTLNHFLQTYDFRLTFADVTPPIDQTGGKFTLKIVSSDATAVEANTLLNNIANGNEVKIWFGKDDAGKILMFDGIMETHDIIEENSSSIEIQIDGPDWGSNILKNRVIQGYWEQKKQADGQTPDTTDTSTSPQNIAVDILTIPGKYPSPDGVTAEAQGINVDPANIVALNNIPLSQFTALTEILDDKLSELDSMAQTIHFVDPNKNFIMRSPFLSTSLSAAQWMLVDDYLDTEALKWDKTKLALMAPGSHYKKTLENYKRRLFGVGGDETNLDQKFETYAADQNMYSLWQGVQFQPTQRQCYAIGVYVKKIGNPQADLTLILLEDNGNSPTGQPLRTVSIPKEKINTSIDWKYVQMGVELNTSKKHWIVIPKIGLDSSNTYAWGKDSGTANVNANSSDGSTYTVNSGSYGFDFREYSSASLLKVYPSNVSASDKMLRELVIRKPTILTRRTMDAYLQSEAATLFKEKHIWSGKIYSPDTVFMPLQKIRIRKGQKSPQGSSYAVDSSDFVISKTNFVFQGDEKGATGSSYFDLEAVRFVNWP